MAESVFAQLCRQARDAGAKRLKFEVDLDAFLSGPATNTGRDGSWKAGVLGEEESVGGRTGEEALRLLVDRLMGAGRR